jgi:hypothetical protein
MSSMCPPRLILGIFTRAGIDYFFSPKLGLIWLAGLHFKVRRPLGPMSSDGMEKSSAKGSLLTKTNEFSDIE